MLDTGTFSLKLSAVVLHPNVEEHVKGKKVLSRDVYTELPKHEGLSARNCVGFSQ